MANDDIDQQFARLEVGPRKRSYNETPVIKRSYNETPVIKRSHNQTPPVREISRIQVGQANLDEKIQEYTVLKGQIDTAIESKNIRGFSELAEIALSSRLFSDNIKSIMHRIAFMIDGLPQIIPIISSDITELQIQLYTLFFGAIIKYHTNSRGILNQQTLSTGEPSNEDCSISLERLFVEIQQLIHGFCVTAVGDNLQPRQPRSYAEYMLHRHHFHFFKMVFVIANGLLSSSPDQIDQIRDMIHFLIRSVCISLSNHEVSQIVGFIFRLHQIARVIAESPPENRNKKVVKYLTPAIKTAHGLMFPIRSSIPTFRWLQELVLPAGTAILNESDWTAIASSAPKNQKNQMRRLTNRLGSIVVSPDGGSNKKKRSSKKSKKSKKSSRNKKVRANKKSRRSNKYKNT
jgi:hypothetical protein